MKVQVRKNKRMFTSEDDIFFIQAEQVKEIPEKCYKDYSIKQALFNGDLKATEGEKIVKFKAANILISAESPDFIYGLEYGKYFIKDLDLGTITWVAEDTISKNIIDKLNNNTTVISTEVKMIIPEEIEIKTEVKQEEPLKKKKKAKLF